ncbi:MAG: hypothetical protein IKN54_08790 [Lachnospiraceae bacterium]|nr:hypothetical protein [Lachnospiraceae bacterium]
MRKSILKRISAVACAAVLTFASATTCFAANWESYWGYNSGWNEGAAGELKSVSDTGWEAYYEFLGWGGIWGAQVKDLTINIPAGETWNLSFTLSSTDCDKWVFIKVTNEDKSSGDTPVLYGDWVKVPAGGKVNYSQNFTVDADATQIYFGIGGEMGDRPEQGIYDYCKDGIPNDLDATYYTTLTMSNYSLAPVSDVPNPGEKTTQGGGSNNTTPGQDNPVNPDNPTPVNVDPNRPVATGDFKPFAFAGIAIVAASAVVVFTRKREEA